MERFERLYQRFRSIWESRPRNLSSLEEIEAWARRHLRTCIRTRAQAASKAAIEGAAWLKVWFPTSCRRVNYHLELADEVLATAESPAIVAAFSRYADKVFAARELSKTDVEHVKYWFNQTSFENAGDWFSFLGVAR